MPDFRHSICNEAFEGWPFDKACRTIRQIGYTGIEIAPFTLAEKPTDISAPQRKEYSGIIESEGLQYVGLHWIMASPKGLHVTTPDAALRARSWDHVRDLIDLSADLGPGGVLVFGSPNQRRTTGGLTRAEATRNMADGLAAVAPHAADRGVTVLLEALPANQCDVVQSLDEAVQIVEGIGSPFLQTMFDVHNAVDECEPHDALVDRHFAHIRHVHVNEFDGSHCGTGGYDFKPVFEMLRRRDYSGWVSLEAFDFTTGAERLANESLRYLESEIGKLKS
jgi:D-psicose/D-tagatose/L-ribulose 3-epimerase